jgi:hypothetical protein
MTCYNIVKQEAERKRREEEKRREEAQQKIIDRKKHYLHMDYVREAEERKRLAHEGEQSRLQRDAAAQRKRREEQEELLKKRKWPEIRHHYAVEGTEPLQIFTPLITKRKPPAQEQNKEQHAIAGSILQPAARKKERKKAAVPLPQKQPISLSAEAGLPVSLSAGQNQVQALFKGRNSSPSPISVTLEAVALDSQKNRLQPRLEPRAGTIAPEGELEFRAELDLPEDVSRGRLTLSAMMKENAIYVDRQPSQSNTVTLSSQVKSPMGLQYIHGSARFDGGALLLSFRNVGESGGILETASCVSYAGKGGAERKASLASRTKVKGGQKSAELSFSPAEPAETGQLEIMLVGKDSNGKPYALKEKISEKEGSNPS